MAAPRKLVIIDGYSLLYRAFFATRFLSTSDGRPTNALLGFTNMLMNLLDTNKPDAIVVALDAPGKTFRHTEFAEYKGTRRETPEELKAQFPVARELIGALGIPCIEVTGFEADDVVGTISRLGEANGYDTLIVTGDLDSLQLVDDHVSVMTNKVGVSDTITYDPASVHERYGFGPEHIPDYKAIVGDTSDNIPGVPGIGEKGAKDLITKFGTIEEIIDRFAELDPKYQKKIEGQQQQMMLSKWLATIDCKAPIAYDFKPFTLSTQQVHKMSEMFEWLEFKSLQRRAPFILRRYVDGYEEPEDGSGIEVRQERIEAKKSSETSFEGASAFVGEQPFAIFFGGAGPASDLFEDEPKRLAYLARGLDVVECDEKFALKLLEERPGQAILHDAKPHYRTLDSYTDAPRFDTMLGAYVLQSGRTSYALRDLVSGYLDAAPPENPGDMSAALFALEGALRTRLEKESQTAVINDIELPLVPVLAGIEKLGIKVSSPILKEFSKTLEIEIDKTQKRVFELAGQEFLIGSPKQLGEVLFDKLQIPGGVKTKTGYATGAEILQQMAPSYEIVTHVLTWRELSKLKGTYTDSLERLIASDGRIHTTYSQTVAATGRLSSNDPNLQNIPIRTELGRGIRRAFVADEGQKLLSIDYSQIELRVLAHMCRDEALVHAFETHQDVHTVTAQQMFGLGEGQATKEQRRLAKMLNYAVLYGVTDFGLANQLGGGFSIAEAKALITQYYERFPKVKAFTDGIVAEARARGFTTTLLGRRRYFPDIHAAKFNERKYAERQAMNAPLQGTAADMMKVAMLHAHKALKGAPTRMLLSVHDEIVFEMPSGDEGRIESLRAAMENALPLSVPVEADAKMGMSWDETTEIPRPVPVSAS